MKGNELRAVIARNRDTAKNLAENLGINKGTLSQKIGGKQDFWRHEIAIIKERYNLTPEDIDAIFFAPDVSSEDTNATLQESEG